MSKRYINLLKNQPQVKVEAKAHNNQIDARIWLLTLGATVAASAVYLVGFFFSFTGGCVPAGD